MELMILRMNNTKNEYYAGFNRHEWLAFSSRENYGEFVGMLSDQGYFERYNDGNYYKIAFIDLKTAKAVDKKFGFEGSFIDAFKERTVKEE